MNNIEHKCFRGRKGFYQKNFSFRSEAKDDCQIDVWASFFKMWWYSKINSSRSVRIKRFRLATIPIFKNNKEEGLTRIKSS